MKPIESPRFFYADCPGCDRRVRPPLVKDGPPLVIHHKCGAWLVVNPMRQTAEVVPSGVSLEEALSKALAA